MKDNFKIKGHLDIKINGKLVRSIPNLVVTLGLEWIAAKLYSVGVPSDVVYMAMGTGTTAATLGDTDLETPILPRTMINSTNIAGSAIIYNTTFATTGTIDFISEAGLFIDATAANSLIARTTFTPIEKKSDDQVTITWTLTVG